MRKPGKALSARSGFFFLGGAGQLGCPGLDFHVTELVRVENLATFLALDELSVFLARHDANPGVFAGSVHGVR